MAVQKTNWSNERIFKQLPTKELRKGEVRKLQIVEATIECLAKLGWNGTNYETVGRACRMKRPHVAYHFPVWNELILTSIQFVYATGQGIVSDYLREAKTPKERLRQYIEGTFFWLESHPSHAASITLLWHLANFDKVFRALSTKVKRLGAERLEAMLFEGQGRAKHRWQQTVSIHGLIVGRCVEYISTDLGSNRKTIAKETFEMAWKFSHLSKRKSQ